MIMEYSYYNDMVQLDQDKSTQCAVYDQTPNSEQKKINIVVRPAHTVAKVISDIKTQYRYDNFELVLQPVSGEDLVYLNDRESELIYKVAGFETNAKNNLVLIPTGKWDGNVKARYELVKPKVKSLTNGSVAKKSSPSKSPSKVAISAAAADCTDAAATQTTEGIKKSKTSTKLPVKAATPAVEETAAAAAATTTTTTPKSEVVRKLSPTKSLGKATKVATDTIEETEAGASSATAKKSSSIVPPSTATIAETTVATTTTAVEMAPVPPPPPPPPPSQTATSVPATPIKSKKVVKKKIIKKVVKDSKTEQNMNKLVSDMSATELQEQQQEQQQQEVSPITMTTTTTTTTNSGSNSADDINNHDVGLSPPSSMTTVTNATNSDSLNLSPMSEPDPLSDDDLALGASASPTESEPIQLAGDVQFDEDASSSHLKITFHSGHYDFLTHTDSAPTNNGYVGLVNQAMTCYLNSLLQALYMTPEFRNALYRWEFDNDNESKNIPYQLQKLFLNLQTSKKSAVETTDLTRSFGWNSSEAWQQHDIQELCRVMFDALEHKFKNTKQANLISNLYEGKMSDYVKCLECNTEKTRSDTFLDIPLPVRPFGSQVAYGSIEEALRAFVQPETLDGNNQYFCEKCNKKCDAHKGLKFKSFPYVLTMHLKRFDFDYTTMYRIKLNDKVTFPQVLNLNTFIETCESEGTNSNGIDDCSTTDSGSAMEEDNWSSGVATTASSMTQNETDVNEEDLDDGIDMLSNTEHRNRTNSDQNIKPAMGPYIYELFAIMIHSGSASGGHYYAYIKELDNNEWFCFNDQTVSPITQEDIQKSFGGGSSKAYYSSVYSSSTNAYMLMYRQVDEKRNEKSLKAGEFPEHISKLVEKLKEEDETRGTRSNLRYRPITDLTLIEQMKPRVYFYNPLLKKMKITRVYVSQNLDLNAVLESAYVMLSVKDFAPQTHCRLVGYEPLAEKIIRSYENEKDLSLTNIRGNDDSVEFLLEFRSDDQQFECYEPGGATWYVFVVKLSTMEMDGPFFVYSQTFQNNDTLRHSIAMRLNLNEDQLMVATKQRYKKAFVTYDTVPTKEGQERLDELARSHFKDITYVYVNVPNTDISNLEVIGISASEIEMAMEQQQQQTAAPTEIPLNDTPLTTNNNSNDSNSNKLSNGFHHECNSEDSSLSDGDRTLVENLQHRSSGASGTGVGTAGCGGDSQISSTSHSPQLSSPDDENNQESINRINAFYNGYSHGDCDQSAAEFSPQTPQFFHAIKLDVIDTVPSKYRYSDPIDGIDEAARKSVASYKVLVDSHMKLSKFKQHIQQLIKVPENYFDISRKHDRSLKDVMNQSLVYICDGETLSVELGRELQGDERKAKVFFMRLSELDNATGRLPCVCQWIYTDTMTVPAAKTALISKLQRIDPVKYKTLRTDNCRLWLKGGRSPIKIFSDEDVLGSELRTSAEFIIQECEEGIQPQVDDTSLTIFVRQWHPDTLVLDKFQEITLDKTSEIRSVLSKLSSIPEENIAYTKVNGTFPYTNVSLLTINSAMSWFSVPATLGNYPLWSTVSANLYFYKDSTVEPKELTPEERREMSAKEKTRLDNLGGVSSSRYSPRRERALKIYLDSPVATASPPVDANSSMADD